LSVLEREKNIKNDIHVYLSLIFKIIHQELEIYQKIG